MEGARALGRGSYSRAGIGEPSDRRLGIQGRSGRELASNDRGFAWARRKGGQGHAPGVTPWPAPCQCCRRSVGGENRRGRGEDEQGKG